VTKGPRVFAIPFVLATVVMGGAAGTAEASPPSAALSPAALLPPPPPGSTAQDNDPSDYGGNPTVDLKVGPAAEEGVSGGGNTELAPPSPNDPLFYSHHAAVNKLFYSPHGAMHATIGSDMGTS
jgi:hypothetical protein